VSRTDFEKSGRRHWFDIGSALARLRGRNNQFVVFDEDFLHRNRIGCVANRCSTSAHRDGQGAIVVEFKPNSHVALTVFLQFSNAYAVDVKIHIGRSGLSRKVLRPSFVLPAAAWRKTQRIIGPILKAALCLDIGLSSVSAYRIGKQKRLVFKSVNRYLPLLAEILNFRTCHGQPGKWPLLE
jgi:hypothetical protein